MRSFLICAPLFFFLVVALPNATLGQMRVGPKFGSGLVWQKFSFPNEPADISSVFKVGYGFGVSVDKVIIEGFSFHTELMFSMLGRKSDVHVEGYIHDSRFNYWEVPVLVSKDFAYGQSLTGQYIFFFTIGPNFKYFAGGKGAIGRTKLDYKVVFDETGSDIHKMYLNKVSRILIGLDVGIGIIYPITKEQDVSIELRYTHGHSQFGDQNSTSHIDIPNFFDDLEAKMRVIRLSATYNIYLDARRLKKGKSISRPRR